MNLNEIVGKQQRIEFDARTMVLADQYVYGGDFPAVGNEVTLVIDGRKAVVATLCFYGWQLYNEIDAWPSATQLANLAMVLEQIETGKLWGDAPTDEGEER